MNNGISRSSSRGSFRVRIRGAAMRRSRPDRGAPTIRPSRSAPPWSRARRTPMNMPATPAIPEYRRRPSATRPCGVEPAQASASSRKLPRGASHERARIGAAENVEVSEVADRRHPTLPCFAVPAEAGPERRRPEKDPCAAVNSSSWRRGSSDLDASAGGRSQPRNQHAVSISRTNSSTLILAPVPEDRDRRTARPRRVEGNVVQFGPGSRSHALQNAATHQNFLRAGVVVIDVLQAEGQIGQQAIVQLLGLGRVPAPSPRG